ncbi:Inner membrane protein YbjJ [compost metagenome]
MILIFGLGALSMMPLTGFLMSKFASQHILRIFSLIASVALIPVGLSPYIIILVPTLFFLGATIGGMNVAMNSNAVAVEKAHSRAVLSSCHCFWSIGLSIAGLVGGYLVENFGFLIHILIICSVAFALTLAVSPLILKDARPKTYQVIVKRGLLGNFNIYIIGIIAFLAMIPECAVVDWSSRYLLKDLNATTDVASFAFACFAGTMALCRYWGDALRNRFSAILIVRVSSLIAGGGLFTAAIVNNPLQAILAFAISGIGIANLVPIAFSAAGNQPNVTISTGMSIATTIGYLGTLLAPAPIGFIAQKIGFPIVYIALAVMLVVIFLLAPFIRRAEFTTTHTAN